MISDQPSAQLWKNQRLIDHHGLIVPEERERLFENTECNNLLEDSLTIYQAKGLLPSHYMHYNMTSSSETETITYQAYINYRCTERDRKAGKTRVIGHLNILYRILRLQKQTVNCRYPFLVLFDAKSGDLVCPECSQAHVTRITQSSFYVMRTQFVYEMINKLTFMGKYPSYVFTPHDFSSKVSNGDTVYEFIKDHNYEPSYYFQRCEQVLVDSLKLAMLKRGIDCQAMRLDEMGLNEEGKGLLNKQGKDLLNYQGKDLDLPQLTMLKHTAFCKLKYMCRKCQPKQIWTCRDTILIQFCVVPLATLFDHLNKQCLKMERQVVYFNSPLQEKYQGKDGKFNQEKSMQVNPEDKLEIQALFKTEHRRLDRSIKREVDEYEEFQKDFKGVGRWYMQLEQYKYPYLVLYSMKVPKMSCQRCKKEKDGLVYITNLIDEAHTVLNRKVLAEIKRVNSSFPSQ